VPLHRGIYLSVTGSCYETPAEIRAAGLSGGPLSHKEVLEVVALASANLADLLSAFVAA
jgi:purine nucleoside phosphorylase